MGMMEEGSVEDTITVVALLLELPRASASRPGESVKPLADDNSLRAAEELAHREDLDSESRESPVVRRTSRGRCRGLPASLGCH